MKYNDLYKKANVLWLESRIPYIEYMDELLDNCKYKTYLFYDEFDTKLIRLHWNPNKEERMEYSDICEKLMTTKETIGSRLSRVYLTLSSQIGMTCNYYQGHKISKKLMTEFKTNIEDLSIDERVKNFIIKNNKNTLEQLIIENLINWSENSIRDIKFITEYFESRRIKFNNKSSVQEAVQELELTEEELDLLEQANIITYNDLINTRYNDLKNMNLSEVLERKIKNNIGLTFEKRGIFKKLDTEVDEKNIEYIDFLEKILYDENYRAFLFFEKEDIKLLRAYHNKYGNAQVLQNELPEVLGISWHNMIKKLKRVYQGITEQTEKTYRFYKNNRMSLKQIEFFKKNIEDVEIDKDLKKLIIEHGLDNLEQYIIKNPIRWNKQTIKMIQKSLDFYKQNKIDYDYASQEQAIIYHLGLTDEEIKELKRKEIINFEDLYKIKPQTLNHLKVSGTTKLSLAKTLNIKYNIAEIVGEIKKGPSGYKEYLERILHDRKYKTFLFLDETETEILRMCYNYNLTAGQISKQLNVEESKINKIIESMYKKIPKQIEETYNYYKDNYMSQRMMNRFKSNIDDIAIDDKIKEFARINKINTLEQLLINNPIDWSKQPIRMIKEITEYFEKKGIDFNKKDETQRLIGRMGITRNEVDVLEKKKLIHVEQIEQLDLDELENKLRKLPVLIRKLRRNLNLNASEETSVEGLKIRYWTGQKIIKNGFETIGDLIKSTESEIQEKCDLSYGELKELKFRLNELGFELKDKQFKKMP